MSVVRHSLVDASSSVARLDTVLDTVLYRRRQDGVVPVSTRRRRKG